MSRARSTCLRASAIASLVASFALPASAAAETRVVARGGAPWLFLDAHAHGSAAGDVATRARDALRRASPSIAKVALEQTSVHAFGDGDTIVRFEQTYRGLPVIGRGATTRLSPRSGASMVAVDLEEDLPASVTPRLDAASAAAKASARAPVAIGADDAHLVVWPMRSGPARLAWAVVPRVPAGLPMAPRVIVDAETGKVLEARDMVRFAQAQVHRYNPVKTPALMMDELALAPVDGKLSNPFLTSTNCVDNKTVKPVNMFGFKASVHVCDLTQTAVANASGNFVYEPSDDGGASSKSDSFSEVQMYYHAAKAYQFFRQLQGVADAKVVFDKPLPVIANLQLPSGLASGNLAKAGDPNIPLEPFSNAFFSPAGGGLGQIFNQLYGLSSGGLWFGQGQSRDYAYDGDVVYHEFGHAVVDDTLKLEAWHVDARGAVDAPGAMNEALADYFSSAITGDAGVGEYASSDLSPGRSVIRTLANEDRCPTHVLGEVHFDSTLFSGALWQARTSLPEADRAAFDAALYKAMRANPGRGDLGFDDLGELFLAVLATDMPAGSAALDKALHERGILPSCERVFEYPEGGLKAIDRSLGGFAAPGAGMIQIGSELVPGLIQLHVRLADKSAGKVSFSFVSRKSRSAGAASPFGGDSVPFTPVVIAKFGKPITWTVSAGKQGSHDADVTVDPSGATGRVSAEIEIPAGATDVYLQITNKGDEDGSYDDLQVELLPADAPPRTNPEEPAPTAPAPEAAESGCACSTPGAPGSPLGAAGLGLGTALALAALRRRRA